MRKFRTAALAVAFTAALIAGQGTTAYAAAGTKVKGVGTVTLNNYTYDFSFNGASGNKGGFTILNTRDPKNEATAGKASLFCDLGNNTTAIVGAPNRQTDPTLDDFDYLVIVSHDSGTLDESGDTINFYAAPELTCPTSTIGLTPLEGYIDVSH